MSETKQTPKNTTQTTPPPAAPAGNQTPAVKVPTPSERFQTTVMRLFGTNNAGELQVTDYQKTLVQGYFIGIDRALKKAEASRLYKNANNKDPKYNVDLPATWDNVNLSELSTDVIHFARMGLDMMIENHLSAVLFHDKTNNRYNIGLMPGYNGIRYIAEKYAVTLPIDVTIELVYSTDDFKPVKKTHNQPIEDYIFEISEPFNRGEIIGGFGYISFEDPIKNKLITMSMADIKKRKPEYASGEFWGGEKTVWEKGQKVTKQTDGWLDEMCRKTLIREVFSAKHIPRDPKKIDENFQQMRLQEARLEAIMGEADAYQNTEVIDIQLPALPPVQIEPVQPPQKAPEAPAPIKQEVAPPAPAANVEPEQYAIPEGWDDPNVKTPW